MPVNKDAMACYRILDRMLADPNRDYTTAQIARAVSMECPKVTLRAGDQSSLSFEPIVDDLPE